MIEDDIKIDVILISPPYNMTKRKGGYADTGRYDVYEDWKSEQQVKFAEERINNI